MIRETLFLKLVLAVLAGSALIFVTFTFPALLRGSVDEYSPVLVGMYISVVPFLFGLYQALVLLKAIDHNAAFSEKAVKALKKIKHAALGITVLYCIGLPLLYKLADHDDAPGVLAIGIILAGASLVVATFAAVLQKLIQSALDIKHENDLTV